MASSQDVYDHSPAWVQYLLLNIYSAKLYRERYGKEFKAISLDLDASQWFSKEEIIEYQSRQLGALVRHCYDTVPYYHHLFKSLKIQPGDITTVDDLQKIPVLTKEHIRENQHELLSTEKSVRTNKITFGGTSGTTGTPLRIAWDQHMRIFNNAVDWRQKKWAGVEPGDRIALLLGRTIIRADKKNPPFWLFDRFQNFLWMSAFHLNRNNLPHYIDKLLAFKPKAIEGFPSILFEVAKYFLSANTTLKVQAVFSSSEPLHEHYRETIERAFCCKVYDFYGLAERTVFATQCGAHSGHHLNFEYGITEIVDSEDQRTDHEGHLVTTGLQNFGMPLLRYKITDRSSIMTEACSCGRAMPRIHSIDTKARDIIYRVDGTPIFPSILTHAFKPITSIEKSQIIQTARDQIVIKIVKTNRYTAADSDALFASFGKRVGKDMHVDIQEVENIPREKSGKYRWVINNS